MLSTPVAQATDYSRFVVGYHGCDLSVAKAVLLGDDALAASWNNYDWLGSGVYFWEHGPVRALEFAVSESRRDSRKISKPTAIGAYIFLGNCFDLLDTRYTSILEEVYQPFVRSLRQQKLPIPKNEKRRSDGTKLLHRRDRAVIEFAMGLMDMKFDTVRGAFWEGPPVYPGAEIRKQSHIQIAVRNPECVLGYFMPRKLVDGLPSF